MKFSKDFRKSIMPLVGCFLITSVLMKYIGILNSVQIGVGMGFIIVGFIKAINSSNKGD